MENFKPEELFKNITDVEILNKLPTKYLYQKCILGIDIYKYSQYPLAEQIYIPVLFDSLYISTIQSIIEEEAFIFFKYGLDIKSFQSKFISTGDGGFQIFDNPVEAIVFALMFQMTVKRFVSGSNTVKFRKQLHQIIDNIELRYSITSDLVYTFKSNYFGPGIINNARILSKDSLNRLLIDSNTIKWFTNNINSVENLIIMNKNSFLQTNFFKDYDKKLRSDFFESKESFKSIDVLKIGSITAKNTSLDVYNLHIQALVTLDVEKQEYAEFMITLGNLNTAGIQ